MTVLIPRMLYHQPANIPANLHAFRCENSGNVALVNAARDILDGKKAIFALCTCQPYLAPEIVEIVTLAMGTGGDPAEGYSLAAPRFCGEDDDPDGAGSYNLGVLYGDQNTDLACIAVAMANAFHVYHYFRLR